MESKIINSDCLEGLKQIERNSVQTCITSPPYWQLRDYGQKDQLGTEKTPEEFVSSCK
jgi:site-specific DNA-methyltransferase (adenine-specific)